MKKKIKLTGNAETVGYAIDAIKDKDVILKLTGERLPITDYEVKSISLDQTKDPYQLVATIKVNARSEIHALLLVALKKGYSTLKVVS